MLPKAARRIIYQLFSASKSISRKRIRFSVVKSL